MTSHPEIGQHVRLNRHPNLAIAVWDKEGDVTEKRELPVTTRNRNGDVVVTGQKVEYYVKFNTDEPRALKGLWLPIEMFDEKASNGKNDSQIPAADNGHSDR